MGLIVCHLVVAVCIVVADMDLSCWVVGVGRSRQGAAGACQLNGRRALDSRARRAARMRAVSSRSRVLKSGRRESGAAARPAAGRRRRADRRESPPRRRPAGPGHRCPRRLPAPRIDLDVLADPCGTALRAQQDDGRGPPAKPGTTGFRATLRSSRRCRCRPAASRQARSRRRATERDGLSAGPHGHRAPTFSARDLRGKGATESLSQAHI